MDISEQSIEDAFVAYRATRDPAALARVYDATSSRLLAVALHLSGRANLAEDAVQETFLFALENPERWDAQRPLLPWLLGILSNRVRKSAYKARQAPDPDRLIADDVRDPGSESEASEMMERIDDAITHLPQPYRLVVLLRMRNGLSTADIALALGRKPSTVRVQLARGVEMLRKALPAGVAALLIGTANAARGLDAVREPIMQRATEVYDLLVAQHRAALLSRWTSGALGGVAFVVAIWAVWWISSEDVEPAFAAENPEAAAVEQPYEPIVREELLPVASASADANDSERVARTGSLLVSVSRPSLMMPSALVEIEPLGRPARAFVHHTSTTRGNWRQIVPARPNPPSSIRTAMTALDGTCRFEGLTVGHWVCRSLGVAEVVEVVAGEDAEVALGVEVGSRVVNGMVVGRDGLPVQGAEVWISREQRRSRRRTLAHTDAAGRFHLAIAPWTTVGVSHAGYAPMAISLADNAEMAPAELRFELREPGASLTGRVVDEDDQPLAGIEVEVGHSRDVRQLPFCSTVMVAARPVRVLTDAEGRFVVDSLVPGETVVSARGGSYGERCAVVDLVVGEANEVSLVLSSGVEIRGVVQNGAGEPVVGASVRIGRRGSLGHRATVTDATGSYVLGGVTAGRPLIEVADYRGGFARAVIDCAPGQRLTWNATLSIADLLLQGRVIDAADRPLLGGWVVYMPPSGRIVAPLDDFGAFSIPVSERDAARAAPLHVFDHDPRDSEGQIFGIPRLVRNDLRVGRGEIEVRLPPIGERSVWLKGRLVGADGKPPEGAVRLRHSNSKMAWRLRLDPLGADGSFEVGPLPAGDYAIHVYEGAKYMFGPLVLQPDEVRDLGEVRVDQIDRRRPVHFGIVYPPGATAGDGLQLEVTDEAGELVVAKYHGAGVSSASGSFLWLPQGRFTVTAKTDSGLHVSREVVIDERRRDRVRLLRLQRQ